MLSSTAQAAVSTGLETMGRESSVVAFEGFGDLLTMDDCGGILQQSTQTVRRLCRENELPSVRIGRRLYVPKSALIAFVQNQIQGVTC